MDTYQDNFHTFKLTYKTLRSVPNSKTLGYIELSVEIQTERTSGLVKVYYK